MNTATIFIKTEPKVKEEAQKTAEELGFSLSSILNAFLRQFVKTKAVHFSVRDETPNAYLRSLLKQAEEDLQTGNCSPRYG
jgi:addiction module RelB/DinJ family antitoxin